MRVAVCFFGQIRTGGVKAAPSILRYIGDLRSQCDIFVHTWDQESLGTACCYRASEGYGALDEYWFKTHPTNNKNLTEFYSIFNPRVIQVEEHNLQKTLNKWGGRRWDPVANVWNVSMWRSIQESNKLKMDYAAKNNITYDYTVLLRTDLVFGENKRLALDLEQISHDKLILFGDFYNVFPTWKHSRLEDIFWIAKSSVIDKFAFFSDYYSSTVTNINDPSDPGYRDWQLYAANWVTNTLGFEFRPLNDNTIRAFCQIDVDEGIDPMNPGFGDPPGSFGRKRLHAQ
jgi:hypothetical protein